MMKFIVLIISLVSIQTQAKYATSNSKNLCAKSQIQFYLDGKSHCLNTKAPITNSEYDKPIRDISNSDSVVRTF